jgi:GH15 family glucan-1,4-alpha-glucosidase
MKAHGKPDTERHGNYSCSSQDLHRPKPQSSGRASGKVWVEPDEGIWETRGGRQHFTYSKVMVWVAFDRAIRIASELDRRAPIARWEKVRDEIHQQVCERGYNRELGSFVQAYDSHQLDASWLLIPLVGFLPHDDRVSGAPSRPSSEN